jgi:PAS domain S-box-containing protein
MKFYFQRKVLLGFLLAISIISGLGIISYLNNQRYKQSNAWVIHTNQVQFHAQRILSLIVDIESGQRGYIISGDTSFLEPYHSGAAVIRQDINDLKKLVADNPVQSKRVDVIDSLVERKLKFAFNTIAMRQSSVDSAIEGVSTLEGKILMDHVRETLDDFQEEEKRLLAQRVNITENDLINFSSTFTALMIATVGILVAVFWMINLNLKARTEARIATAEAMARVQDMYDNAPCGYHSLDANGYFIEINQTELGWLGYTREEIVGKKRFPDVLTPQFAAGFDEAYAATKLSGAIRDVECEMVRKNGTTFPVILNATLLYDGEGKVLQSRSTVFDYTEKKHAEEKIIHLNHELEAFTYSVSHDLRAPLRSIDGYARILSDDYAKQLDTEGQRVLSVIIRNANRMGRLIDDLLDFSRVGRKDINVTRFNMNTLVKTVFDEQMENDKTRTVECRIHNLADAASDPQLVKQVWVNLISNALKYSRKKEKSVVEISSQTTDKEVIYTISDNGTGFDMQYSHKLFNVFQRLHKTQDFEGTGVGLAIVQRIISRHGGRVWAEGRIDEGASFHFSLPVNHTA